MKKINYIICMAALAGTCLNATAQDNKELKTREGQAKEAQAKQAQDEQMKAWMTYMTPGPMHEMLAKSNGEWNEEVTMWMDPSAPPTKSTATCTNTMILGGRYQQSMSKGSFNGMPFEGTSTVGYDNAKKVFVSTWIDNMGTGIMFTEGKYDEKTKTINFGGNCVDPMTGKEMKVRETFKIIDDNNQFMEMFMTQNGKEFKTMEIKFTRKM
jgi:uncharacterized protein DUF1579